MLNLSQSKRVKRVTFKRTAIAILVASLTACASVGPDYQAPTKVNEQVIDSQYSQAEHSLDWWQAFDDAELNRIVSLALAQNRTLLQASLNVERAQAIFGDTDNDTLPKGSLGGSHQSLKSPSANPSASMQDNDSIIRTNQVGANLSWDVDLFGKLRRASEAAKANSEQARLLWREAKIQLISQVASSYGELRGAELRHQVAKDNRASIAQSRSIIHSRFEAGFASELELARIDAQRYELEANLLQLEQDKARAKATLSALLGQTEVYAANASVSASAAQSIATKGSAVSQIPTLKQPLAMMDTAAEPVNYLQHRADVAAAERAIASTSAKIGVASADLYPNVSVSGFLGFIAPAGVSLSSDNQAWSVAPNISWQLADLSSIKSRIKVTEIEQQIALAEFEQTVFNALADMRLSLTGYSLSQQQLAKTELQWQATLTALNIEKARYQAGTSEFLALLDAEREQLRSQDKLAQMQQQSFSQLVNVYRSFAGSLSLTEG
ncbi:RND efflux system, outer membrane lipoprotein, NodT [Shewanella denitrificans OS217]|uniref:RND efflux system, outer membrane lipoprotein, NodT n=1 Tax=Shewanella denitrificans (strain OS217 / ATCC BAA-1090 / DSM 15013) TaxID=318161 RepID=Q12JL7_SHEDO|nr:TolC family protein [Shewanella denitrificans]ABE56359.1 RND efflux system, outer membrane lipoprotein, NodT [Shewanella denitrificans OS217]